jgi:hypothetical protein
MPLTVCLAAKTLYYPAGGGHLWAYLNWALGLKALGCRVIWFEGVNPETNAEELQGYVQLLKGRLARYGLHNLALWAWWGDGALSADDCMPLEEAIGADLLLNQQYGMRADLVCRFRRSALLDIDPGLTQVWLSRNLMQMAPHDVYFTIGETVGQGTARFPDNGLPWQYTPPCVALDWWPVTRATENAAFTTVTHWSMDEWEEEDGQVYSNDKRTGFLPYLELPGITAQPLELALRLGEWDQDERISLETRGWRVRDSEAISSTPWDYQRYIQQSRGEFSCVKPSCIRLQNAWISDRTICYLASGKPALVEHTGPSRFLPETEGLIRFRSLEDAAARLDEVAVDYERHCELARALAEEYFDARKVAAAVVERALA